MKGEKRNGNGCRYTQTGFHQTDLATLVDAEREMVRKMLPEGEFIEIFVDTPLADAEKRDPKGLYAKARAGEIKNFTGIDSPYEVPDDAEIVIDTTAMSEEDAADLIVEELRKRQNV